MFGPLVLDTSSGWRGRYWWSVTIPCLRW